MGQNHPAFPLAPAQGTLIAQNHRAVSIAVDFAGYCAIFGDKQKMGSDVMTDRELKAGWLRGLEMPDRATFRKSVYVEKTGKFELRDFQWILPPASIGGSLSKSGFELTKRTKLADCTEQVAKPSASLSG